MNPTECVWCNDFKRLNKQEKKQILQILKILILQKIVVTNLNHLGATPFLSLRWVSTHVWVATHTSRTTALSELSLLLLVISFNGIKTFNCFHN